MRTSALRGILIFFAAIVSLSAQIAVVSSATFLPAVAPSSIVTAFGSGLAPQSAVATFDQNGHLPTTLGSTSVTVNGEAASLIYVSSSQVIFVIPSDTTTGAANISIKSGGSTQTGTASVQLTAGGIFTIPCLRPDRSAVENAITGTLEPFSASTSQNSGNDKRTILSAYGTGLRYAGNSSRTAGTNVAAQVTATITDSSGNTYNAPVLYAGSQPTLDGLDQINFVLPAAVENLGTVYLQFNIAGQNSNSTSMVMSTSFTSSGQLPNLLISSVSGLVGSPAAVAFDSLHNLYIADAANHVVRRMNANGTISLFAGNGADGSSGDGAAAISAQLRRPVALAFDRAGNLFIADSDDNRIRKVTSSGIISTVAGTGTAGFAGDGGAGISAQLQAPGGIAVDAAGTVVFADTGNNRVRRITSDGVIATVAGTGSAALNTSSSAYLSSLNQPTDVAIDSEGNIFVADAGNFIVRRITPSGGIFTVAGNGVQGSSGTNCAATQASLSSPVHLAFDASGGLWVSDAANNKIRLIDANCYITDAAGTGSAGFSGDGGVGTQAQISGSLGLTVDQLGDIYIADTGNQRVRKLSANGGVTVTFSPPNPTPGQPVTGTVGTGGTSSGGTSSGGTTLQLSSNPAIPGLPSSIVIPAGQSAATFSIIAPALAGATPVSISASGSGVTGSGSFTVTPPLTSDSTPVVGNVTVDPGSTTGGKPVVGKLNLLARAPIGGAVVSLKSDTSVASVTPSITIPEGQTSGAFTITTANPSSATPATITASTPGSAGSAILTVNPAATLSGINIVPAIITGGQAATGTVSLNSPAGADGVTVALATSNPAVSVPAAVTVPAGSTSATFGVSTAPASLPITVSIIGNSSNTASGTVNLTPAVAGQVGLSGISIGPASISGGTSATGTVTLASPAPAGGATVALSSSIPAVSVPASITIPAGQTSGTFAVQTNPVNALINGSISASGTNTVSSLVSVTAGAAPTASIAGLSVNPATLTGGQSANGTITLSAAAGASGTTIGLSSDNPLVGVPSSVQIAANQTTATFPVTTTPVAANIAANITATGANSQSAPVEVSAPCVAALNLQLTPGGLLNGGSILTGNISLTGAAPSGGTTVQLTGGPTSLGAVLVPAGQSSASVNLNLANAAKWVGASVSASTGICGGISARL